MGSRIWKSLCLVLAVTGLAFVPAGCKKAPPIKLSCNASAPSVYPGEPVTVTATPESVSTKKHNNVIYSWSGPGVTGNGTTASVSTGSLDPGGYTVKGEVKEGKKGKEGLKPGQTATCEAPFTVKAFEPPTIACSASPATIKPGETSTITATASSPQNRPLTYSYSASSGSVSGSGASATFSSTGAPTGTSTVTCTVKDDKDHTATADTTISIVAPPPPPTPHAQSLCSISFATDKRRPTRVNNEAKACLDEVAMDLQNQPNAKAVMVGEATAKEKTPPKHHRRHATPEDMAAQRAVNAKDYLVKEKGIDSSRIETMTSSNEGQSVQNYLVPAGANFANDVQGTTPVNETEVKPQARKPLHERHHHKHQK
jgi:outer membrane protein OmpA-like peptidoglycan-associated protein